MMRMGRWVATLTLCAGVAYAAQCGDVTYVGGGGIAGGDTSDQNVNLYENCADFDTNNTGRINLHGRIKAADTWTFGNASAATYLLEMSPAVTISAAAQSVVMLRGAGTFTQTVSPTIGSINMVAAQMVVQSGTNAVKPSILRSFLANDTMAGIDCGGGACAIGTAANLVALANFQIASVTGGSTTMTVTNATGHQDLPEFDANTAGSTLTITNRRTLWVMDPSVTATGTVTFTNNLGVDIDAQTHGTNVWGIRIAAQATGTNIFPIAIGEAAPAGTVVAGFGVFGVDTGAPNRAYFKNESGHIWRTGYMDLQSNCTTLNTLVASSPFYCPTLGTVAANATEATAQTLGPGGDIHVFAMTVVISAAPGSGVTRTFTLRDDGGDATGLNCAITGTTATQCSVRVETNTSQGTAVASPSLLAVKEAVSGGTAAAARAAISLVYLLDTW